MELDFLVKNCWYHKYRLLISFQGTSGSNSKTSTTSKIFKKPPLKAFRHAKNLKDLLVRSCLQLYLETFRTNQQQLSHLTGPSIRTYVQKCMQWRKWRNWRKIASRWRFELDAKSGPLEAGDFGNFGKNHQRAGDNSDERPRPLETGNFGENGHCSEIGNFGKNRQKCMQWRKWQKNCQPLAI